MLELLAAAGGVALIGGTLLSAVRTMVLPRSARSAITSVTFQSARRLFGLISRPGDFARTDRVMALFAPLTLLALAAVWLTFVLAGFTMLFWVAGYGSWAESFRVSGSSLLTLGTAGLAETGHRLLGFAAAAIGLGLVALLISFLPSLYAAFARREQLVALLEVRAGSPPSAVVMLERFERLGWSDSLSAEWDRWETWFVDIDESHTSYPALVWLRSPHPERSWVTASGTVLDAASLLLAGSGGSTSVTTTPRLTAPSGQRTDKRSTVRALGSNGARWQPEGARAGPPPTRTTIRSQRTSSQPSNRN